MLTDTLKSRPYLNFAIAAALVWTLGAAASLAWNLRSQELAVLDAARTAARTAYEKDIVYRSWSAGHGGVYVPVSESAVPNPFLEGIADRDIVTTEGKQLTLINPSYMNRQVHELEKLRTGARGHLTSLTPIRPGNAPDAWEKTALEAVIAGDKEYSGIQVMEQGEYMRLLRPVTTEDACLKCHKKHGYEVGKIQGGLSISFPMEPFRSSAVPLARALWFWHLFSWLLGMAGIVISTGSLNAHYRRHERSDRLIRDSLAEKEVLLREIHHRVKNNLQVISGMLELQAALVKDPAAVASLKDGRSRVMSMALIHQRLYQSGDMALVPMDSYIESLVTDLGSAYGVGENGPDIKVDAQPVRLNLDTAIPLGLLVSELVTNSIKYAFPHGGEGEKGMIVVTFSEDGNGIYHLAVSDNGTGLPAEFDLDTASSLGLKLVHTLVDQLGGEISLDATSGTSWFITCSPYHGADGLAEPPGWTTREGGQ